MPCLTWFPNVLDFLTTLFWSTLICINIICRAREKFILTEPSENFYFFLDLRKLHFLESIFCGSRWASKISVVSSFYKKYMPRLELKTCCVDLKPFNITIKESKWIMREIWNKNDDTSPPNYSTNNLNWSRFIGFEQYSSTN